ncbi:hypothetical protein [Rhizobium leguminosarum]|uniref:Uncharacterized protein n=1 Tax=Rhizobium leguminosarum TaxID=384 RepID=A0A7K3VUT7_RHILE|nr:hypothetical protein [Rhizobium leguminosarum]NEK20664.1 hypothetical protein [Rhizobium leguminosarum]
MLWDAGDPIEEQSSEILKLILKHRKSLYTTRLGKNVTLSFVYTTEVAARTAVSERDISGVISQVSDVSPDELPANTFDAGLNWFIAFPSNSSTPIDVVGWGKAIRA